MGEIILNKIFIGLLLTWVLIVLILAKLGYVDFVNIIDRGLEAVDKKDYKTAVKLFSKACDGGNARGCYNLGFMYENGEGVQQDYSKAAELYTKACDDGSVKGCYNLGAMYANGKGVQQDYSKAAEFYTKACDGDSGVCFNLGLMYANGIEVRRDKVKATEMYSKACDGGYPLGCFGCGVMYEHKEKGTQQDKELALKYYRKACDMGSELGCENYSELKQKY
jgi:hypothetical protein